MLRIIQQADSSAEVFYSVQGEGINAGKPAVFLRLARCNLACCWCDTKYTWDWQHKDASQHVVTMSATRVEEIITRYGCCFLVITGGEPMLQQKELLPLLRSLKQQGFYCEIETNGTILPVPEMVDLIDHWNISPKLTNSKNKIEIREKPDCYRFLNALPTSHFKFVIDNQSDFQEVTELAQKYGITAGKIVLMPQAVEREVMLEKSKWLVELCKKEGYLFSIRLQILLWGDKRGI